MPVKSLTDTDGVTHQVSVQDMVNSCGPACIYMIECAVKGQPTAGGEDRIRRLQCAQAHNCAEGYFDGRAVSSLMGYSTYPNDALITMKASGISWKGFDNYWGTPNIGKQGVNLSRIGVSNPALVLFGWYVGAGAAVRSGGHYVVAARKNSKGRVVFLDPWLGSVVEEQNNGLYKNNGRLEFVAYTA